MKMIYLIIPLTLMGYYGNAQEISRQVIALNGGNQTVEDLNISYTIGQPIIETIALGDYILTQGFQQPDDVVITDLKEIEPEKQSFQLFPQPANNQLTINSAEPILNKLTIDFYSLTGVRLKTKKAFPNAQRQISLHLNDLKSGFYMISIRDEKNNKIFYEPLIITKK